ncbi:MAG: polyprenyl synthetase family protein [Candidatus Moranbacteria bacterium]|nr:polyprenyl synthetase family protein [Candidatus Moranbacteria bacterium]
MHAIELLKNYKIRFDPHLEAFFREKLKEAGELDMVAEEAVEMIRDYTVSGGKRIRPAVMYYSYLAVGGKDEEKVVKASMSMELLHSFLLIHDDIIDKDASRHGVATIHERYKKIGKKLSLVKDSDHFGNSMAIVSGDLAASMACDIIFNADFPAETILKALDQLQRIVFVTIPGEMIDVIMSHAGEATEEQILKMHEGKTARYTFEGPMHLGAVLAGAEKEYLQQFSDYALPLGKAFQIRDDILGIFGDEKKIGKPVGSDIMEGKQTLLLVKALENGNREQKKIIKSCLNRENITERDVEEFREIIRETGSLEYSENLARKFVEESIAALEKVDFKNEEAKDFFAGIAEYIISREK